MEMTIKDLNIKEIVKGLPSIATKNNWVFTYDEDEGALFYAPNKEIPEGSVLYQVTDEYSLYLNKDKGYALEGMFVECFDKNFIEHHDGFKDIATELFKIRENATSETQTVVNPHKSTSDKAATFKKLLELTFINETLATV